MTAKMLHKALAMLLTMALFLALIPGINAAATPFKDVSEQDWFYDSVNYVFENELMNGIGANTFDPHGNTTRAMALTVLYRLAGKPATDTELPFEDVAAGTYYADAVAWAFENGITTGRTPSIFDPDGIVTREELVVFMYRYAVLAGKDISAAENLTSFPDGADVQPYAVEAMQWAVGEGIVNGDLIHSMTYLKPQDTATRAQISAILMRFVENVIDKETVIQLFQTSDIHGYIVDTSSYNEETYQYRMAYLADVFNDARADLDIDDVILLDSGDIYQGTVLSNLTYGNAIRAALDVMDYDAVCLGNHEFDWDVSTYAADEDGTIPAYELGEFTGDSDAPVLAYNLYDAGTNNRASFVQDYTILEKGGYKIAVIGYIPNYRMEIMASKINPYDIDADLDRLSALVSEVNEKERPTATIILSHDISATIAEAMDPEQVDLVLGGHDHDNVNGIASNGIPYAQGGQLAAGYTSTTLTIDKDGNVHISTPEYTYITEDPTVLYDGGADLDPTVLAISKTAIGMLADIMNEVLGYVDRDISPFGYIDGSDSSVAGNWLTGLMLHGTKDLGTVAAFANTGGIRSEFFLEEGASIRYITVGDVLEISPFSNHLLTYDITGKQLAQQIVNGLINPNYGDQMSGLVATYYVDDEGNYVVTSIILDDGTVVDLNDTAKTYRVVVNEYCATLSGSVFENLTPIQDVNAAPIDNQAAIESLRVIAAENDGYIPLDLTPRRIQTEAPVQYE